MKINKKIIAGILTPLIVATGGIGVYNSDMTEVKSYVSEHGGTYIEDVFREEIIDTGLTEIKISEEVEVVSGNFQYQKPDNLQTLTEAKNKIVFEPEVKQVKGKCVFFSYDYVIRDLMFQAGLNPKGFIINPDVNYASRKYKPNEDVGSVPLYVYQELVENGLAIGSTMKVLDARIKEDRKGSYMDWLIETKDQREKAELFRLREPITMIKAGNGADTLFKETENGQTARFSIDNLYKDGKKCIRFYHTETPFIIDDLKGCTRNGGHSLTSMGNVGVFEYKDEVSFASYESTGSVNKHFIRYSVAKPIVKSWETYKLSGKAVLVKVDKYEKLKSVTLRQGQQNDNVKILEEYLKEKKYFNYTPNTYYGTYTRDALRQYLFNETGVWYSGKYFGSVSQSTIK